MASSNVCWGIEVGSGAVKALKLERDGDQVRVLDFVVIPHKRVLTTPDIDRAEATRLALGALTAQFGDDLRSSQIAMSVPGDVAFARFAKLPPVEQKGVANLVRFEAVQQIPFPIEEVEWDYQTFTAEDSPDIEVGIFAITKDRINELLHSWGEVNLSPDVVTLSPVALYNAIAYDLSFTQKTPGTIILDIGAQSTDLIIAEGGKVWVRTFPLGGHTFTEAVSSTFKLNYGKAERTKRDVENSKHKQHILKALKPVLADLVQDVQRSISYYEDTHPDANLTRLVGVGSSFKLFGLRKLLSQQLQMDVYRLDRFKRISVEGPGASEFEAATLNMSTAYGLALQGLGLESIEANLVPRDVVRKSLWARKTPWFAAAAVLGIVGAGITFIRPFMDNASFLEARGDNDAKRAVQSTVALGNELVADAQALDDPSLMPGKDAAQIRDLVTRRDLYPHLLDDVGLLIQDARSKAANRPSLSGSPISLALHDLRTDYVQPDGAVEGAPRNAGAATPDPMGMGRGGGDATQPDPNAPPASVVAKAGPRGAVEVTIVLETPEAVDLPFIYDSVLKWLDDNADRNDLPYRIVNVSSPEEVQASVETVTVKGEEPKPTTSRSPSNARSSDSNRSGGRRGADPMELERGRIGAGTGSGSGTLGGAPEDRGASQPTQDESSRDQNRSSGGAVDTAALDALAPLPPRAGVSESDQNRKRYTIRWVALMRQPGANAPADESAAIDAGDDDAMANAD